MGSAFLVGSALDQAHHPFLGWLWQATRVLLLVLALTAAVTLQGVRLYFGNPCTDTINFF